MESAAEIFDLSVGAVRALIKRREVPFYKIGSRVRISFREFESQLVRYPSIHEINVDAN
ncbi:MAG: helix-turn-helix domain-containing protein [Candidatus Marinimicrobia bacterium]|nr:helix-turn-helix domain-containing protein [Candidatus Neomarinimicrobiota bacterium]